MNYFISMYGRTIGPMSKEQVFAYPVTENTQVCSDTGQWAPLYAYPELQSELQSRRRGGGYAPYWHEGGSGKDKVGAGVLALLLGGLGAHYFYCGKIAAGFITILLTLATCGLWKLITAVQGIIMLTMTQAEFDSKYVNTDATYPLF